MTKTGPGTLNLSNTWSFNATPGASSITNSAGTVNFNSAIPAGGNVTVNANAATNFAANARLAALNVGAGATATVVDNGSAMRVVNTTALAIDATGTVDLKNNKLVTNTPIGTFTGGAYNGVQGEVARAYDFGSWDLPGLMTSMPDAGPLVGTTTIGVSDGAIDPLPRPDGNRHLRRPNRHRRDDARDLHLRGRRQFRWPGRRQPTTASSTTTSSSPARPATPTATSTTTA